MSAGARLTARYARLVAERGLVDDTAQRAVIARLAALADAIDKRRRPSLLRRALARQFPRSWGMEAPRGIYLWGPVGRGKTWLLDLFAAGLPANQVRRSHFHHFMRDTHRAIAALGPVERPLERIAADIAGRCRALCLDELYVSDISDAMILHGLFSALLAEGVVLAVSSNSAPAALYAGGLQRKRFLPAIALLESRLDVVELAGPDDYRLRHLANADTYVIDGNAAGQARLVALFNSLAEGIVTEGGALSIEGREIPLLRAASGMAWFDFAALCDGPRAAADYIEIARELHTVFLTGVPVLDATRDDAVRRFITLVDELYDRGVKLVVGAATQVGVLYRGERLADAFARTTSRLIEMRSHDYLARAHRPTA